MKKLMILALLAVGVMPAAYSAQQFATGTAVIGYPVGGGTPAVLPVKNGTLLDVRTDVTLTTGSVASSGTILAAAPSLAAIKPAKFVDNVWTKPPTAITGCTQPAAGASVVDQINYRKCTVRTAVGTTYTESNLNQMKAGTHSCMGGGFTKHDANTGMVAIEYQACTVEVVRME